METSSLIALGVATVIVIGLVVGLGLLSLTVGAIETLFGKGLNDC